LADELPLFEELPLDELLEPPPVPPPPPPFPPRAIAVLASKPTAIATIKGRIF
jgi:hypothetical protein